MQTMLPTKNIPSSPGLVEALKHGHHRKAPNLDLFENSFPSHFGVNKKVIPYQLLHLRFVPIFKVKHFVIRFDPNGPKRNASKEVPNFDHFAIPFGNSFPKQNFLPIGPVMVGCSHPTKFMHNEHGPSPCPLGLVAIPKFMFDRLTCITEAKHTLLRNWGRCNGGPTH